MAKPEIFIDTGAFFALQVRDDLHYEEAKKVFPKLLPYYDALVTSNLVISETYTLLRMAQGFQAAWKFIETIGKSPRLQIIYSDQALENEALKILAQFSEHNFSFTDGVSFALMKKAKILHTFAFDVHFKIAGFIRIPQDLKI